MRGHNISVKLYKKKEIFTIFNYFGDVTNIQNFVFDFVVIQTINCFSSSFVDKYFLKSYV